MFDSHCHLQFNAYKDDREAVIKRCLEKGVQCNIVGTQKDTSRAAVELAEKYDGFYATIGLHPIHTTHMEVDEEEIAFQSREESFDEKYYDELAQSKKVIAIGECGIELFHLPPGASKEEILKKQTETFLAQIHFAQKHNLALVIHIRDAYDETIGVLRSVIARSVATKQSLVNNGIAASSPLAPPRNDTKGVVHCFSGNWTQAQQFLDMGFYLGFTGIITFPARKTNPKPTEDLLEVVKKCPLDRILIETDAPYLAPQAYRGERCEPWMVEEVAKKIAELRKMETSDIIEISIITAKRIFGLS